MASSSYYTHRKLLQSPNNINIPTIQTCLYFCNTLKNDTASVSHNGFCPPACLQICPSTCHYSLLPPYNIPPSHTNNHHNLYPLLISMLILLASTFLLITFYVLYTKLYSSQTRDSTRGDDSLDEEHGHTMVFHPIWYIPTVGLNPTVISSIKVHKYDKEMEEISDCAVCLGEFIIGDEFRILPKCNHAFHVSCIDMWLKSRVTCPLCRVTISNDPSIDQGYGQINEVSSSMADESSPSEDVVDVNHAEDCLENSKEEKLEDKKGSSSQRWCLERSAASLVSRSLSCSGKIFSSRYHNRPSPNS